MSHAEFSPSAAHRWLECPGSIRLSRGITSEESVYAKEGTFAHTIAAASLQLGCDADAHIGRRDGQFTVDKEMVDHIQVYLDYVRGLVFLNDATLFVEQSVAVNKDVYGTADAIVVSADEVHVVDFKYGAGQFVAAEGNAQLLTYGTASLLTKKLQPKTIGMHIVQPRCASDRPWRMMTRTPADLIPSWQDRLDRGVAAARDPNAPLKPGDHCKWCPAKNSCPALREQALVTARSVFVDQTLVAAAEKPPSPANLTPSQLATVIAGTELVETWLKGCYEMACDYANRGELPGFKMVAKVGNRKWTDEDLANTQLAAAGINPLAPAKLLSPAQAEKALTKVHGGKKAEVIVDALAHNPITGSSLVPVSDPRPALTNASVFSPVGE